MIIYKIRKSLRVLNTSVARVKIHLQVHFLIASLSKCHSHREQREIMQILNAHTAIVLIHRSDV